MKGPITYIALGCVIFQLIGVTDLFAQKKSEIKSVIEFTSEKGDKEIKKSYQALDKSGNVVEEIEYDEFGKIKSHVKYEFNQQNLKTKEIELNDDGKVIEVTTYEYDGSGNRISKVVTDANGKIKTRKRFEYEYY